MRILNLSGKEEKQLNTSKHALIDLGVSYEKNIGGLGIVAWIGPEATIV